jgi:ketosteroid isomerase-like protein
MSDDQRTPAVLEANEAFYRAFNAKDPDAMDAAWAAEHEVACIHPGWNALLGREEVLASWHNILTNPNQPRIVIGGAQVVFTGDAAIVLCRELVSGAPLIATNVFVQEGANWRLVHHQSGGVAAGMT